MDNKKPNEELNPSAKDYGEKTEFGRLLDAEQGATGQEETQEQAPDAQGVKDREEAPGGTQGLYRPSEDGQGGKAKVKGMLKKKGPLGLIIGLLVGGGLGVSLLFSPAILIVQIKETMVNKFNSQLASMDTRTKRIIKAKTSEATKGLCTTVKIGCRYSSMSERQLKKFEKAGFKVETTKTGLGRHKPTSFSLNGAAPVEAKDFYNKMKTDPEFRKAVQRAYNPKFAGFADKTWTRLKTKFGFDERAPKKVKDADEKKRDMNEKSQKTGASADTKPPSVGDDSPYCEAKCTQAEVNTAKAKIEASNKLYKELGDGVSPGKLGRGFADAFKITGYVDSACSLYYAYQLTMFAAKHIRSIQLGIYAVQFFKVADMIKAGDATPEDVSQLGEILTAAAPGDYSSDKKGPRQSATDSYGYKYAAYGDVGEMSDQTSLFLAGGGLRGTLSGIEGVITQFIPGGRKSAKTTCKANSNPWYQGASLVGGIIFSISNPVGWGKLAVGATIAATVMAAQAILPGILANIIAGKVTEGIQGEDSGDAIASGAGALMGNLANIGGNAPLTKEQALAYNKLNQETAIAYAKDEAAELSPFDTSSRYTFMGSIAHSLMPLYSSNAFSVSGSISSSMSIFSASLSGLIPKASAVSDAQDRAAMDVCKDLDYLEMNVATDPFCNPMVGIPPEYLDADPVEIDEYLYNQGLLDQDGQQTDEYKKWVAKCTDRAFPFGYDDGGESEDGFDCVIDSKDKAYRYLGIIDSRIEDGMDGYDLPTSAATGATGGTVSTYLGNLVFPLATTQREIKSNRPSSWCWSKTEVTCHGTEDSQGYYAADIFITPGTTVVSATDGVVVNITYADGSGQMITIKGNDCADGTQTCIGKGSVAWYGHLMPNSATVTKGQTVKAGDIIGQVGNSSDADGKTPHLHFDISDRKNDYRGDCKRGDSKEQCSSIGFINIQPQLVAAFNLLQKN